MKKVIISAMIVASAIAFMACGGNASNSTSNADTTTAVEATVEGAQGCPKSEGGACDSAACAQKDSCAGACGENCRKAEAENCHEACGENCHEVCGENCHEGCNGNCQKAE